MYVHILTRFAGGAGNENLDDEAEREANGSDEESDIVVSSNALEDQDNLQQLAQEERIASDVRIAAEMERPWKKSKTGTPISQDQRSCFDAKVSIHGIIQSSPLFVYGCSSSKLYFKILS